MRLCHSRRLSCLCSVYLKRGYIILLYAVVLYLLSPPELFSFSVSQFRHELTQLQPSERSDTNKIPAAIIMPISYVCVCVCAWDGEVGVAGCYLCNSQVLQSIFHSHLLPRSGSCHWEKAERHLDKLLQLQGVCLGRTCEPETQVTYSSIQTLHLSRINKQVRAQNNVCQKMACFNPLTTSKSFQKAL